MDPNVEQSPSQQLVPSPSRQSLQRSSYPDSEHSYGFAQANEEDPRGGLLEYWRILRRRKGTVIMVAFAGLVVGILVTLPQTPIYQARASLEIQDVNPEFASLRNQNSATESGSITNALADVQTQIKILQSETLVERSLARLEKRNTLPPPSQPSKVSAWRKVLGLPEPAPPSPEAIVKSTIGRLKARASGQTRIVEITYDSPDSKQASDFVNILTNEFIEQNIDARWKMMQRTGDWLTRQLDDVKIKLERSEDALQSYARQSGLLFLSSSSGNDKQNVTEEKLHQLQAELSRAQAERVSKQSRYEMAKSSPPEALPDVLNDLSLRDYQTKLTDLRRQQAELSATYKPEYSKVRRIEAQIAPLQAALERERQSILVRIKNEYDESRRREKLLTDDYAAQSKLVTSDAEKSIQYNILKREVDTNRQIYESMLQRVKESSISSAMRASNIRVVDAARQPQRPYKPVTSTNGALGTLAGLCLGIAFVVMRERADRTFQQPGDAPFWLNSPELGVIPTANSVYRKPFYYLKRGAADEETETEPRRSLSGTSAANGNSEAALVPQSTVPAVPLPDRVELITFQRRPSVVAEAFRTVLTSLLFGSGQNGNQPRTLVFTSANPGEGKTTVVCNLAIALAEIKQRTLLIDADLRKPRIHSILNLNNERGLSDLLQQRPLAPGALEELIQETAIPGLYALTAGPSTSAAANLLYSHTLTELLTRFRQEFDMVVIDTPPVLQMPDARVVARSADGVILVTRAHRTTRDAAIAASQRFAEDGTRLLGTILNDWNPKQSPTGYYGYYSGAYSGYQQYRYYASREQE